MIRPFTLICMLLACGSGLYLYQTKHRVQLLDREIAQTVQATTAARDRAGVLRTEWTLLNDLERLRALADQYLRLRPVAPGQFTALADLGNRLPAPRAPQPEAAPAIDLTAGDAPAPANEAVTEFTELPTPPLPPPAPPQQTQIVTAANPASPALAKDAAREASAKAAAKATAEAAQARAAERRQIVEAAVRAQTAARPVTTASAAPAYRPPAYNGSATYSPPQTSSLGMASRTALPPPVPVSATQYVTPN